MANPSDVKSIFLAASEKPLAERGAYLAEATAGDAALLARIEALLKAHDKPGSFLEDPATEFAATVDFAPAEPPLAEQAGTIIGPYKLLQQIGEGGMGVVFMAEQTEPLHRTVALKIIKPGMDTRHVIARFEAERQALAMMDHANIAHVLEAGTTDTGLPYFVMDLVKGVAITDYCDQQHLTIHQRLELFTQVCSAVQHAHQKGIIHRDLKPSNVLVAEYDGQPVPKIIDFGVAKATAQKLTERTMFTEFGQLIGTFEYMSPEQARFNQLDVDTRSDIYSLGVLLYELLTGSTPLEKERLRSAAFDEILRIIGEEEPPKPSTRLSSSEALPSIAANRTVEPKNLSGVVRGDLDWIVMKCLEKDRDRRYDTARALTLDLQCYLNDEPVEASPPSAIYRYRKFARRNRVAIFAAMLICGAMAIGTLVSTWQAIRAVKAEREQAHLRATAEYARAESESQRTLAEAARAEETILRREAEKRAADLRRETYTSDIALAQQAITENRLGAAQSLLAHHRPQSGQQDLRGWEWRYLWQQTQGDALFQLCQAKGLICSIATSFDGRLVALGEAIEGGVTIWDLRSRREVTRLPAGNAEIYVAFSPTAPLLAFSSISGPPEKRLAKVELWNPTNQRMVGEIPLGARCLAIAFSADGQTLVSATAAPEHQISMWETPTGKKVVSFGKKYVSSVGEAIPLAVTADAKLAAYASTDRVHVCDLSSGRDLWSEKAAENHLIALAFSPDGKTLATGAGYRESAIRLWDTESGKETRRLEGHSGWVGGLVFSPGGGTLFSASRDRTIRIWDISESAQSTSSRILRGHDEEVWRLALLPDGKTLVSSSSDGIVNVWDRTSSARGPGYAIVPGGISSWQFTPDSRSVVTLDWKGAVRRWLGPDYVLAETLLDLGRDFDISWHSSVISADNRWLAIRRNDDFVEVWDLVRRALHQRLATNSECPWKFLEDGKKLVVLEKGTDRMHVWDVAKGSRLETWRRAILPDRDYQEGDISPDGRWCLTIGLDGTAVLHDIVHGRDEDPQLGVRNPYDVRYSSDSRLIAVTTGDGRGFTKVWEAATKREIVKLNRGNSVSFSPDGKRLAVDRNLWDLETERRLVNLPAQPGHEVLFTEVTFSPDGNVIASRNSTHGELYLWRAPSWDELNELSTTID